MQRNCWSAITSLGLARHGHLALERVHGPRESKDTTFCEAMRIAEETHTNELCFSVRGEIWYQYLWVLREMGKPEYAQKEATRKLQDLIDER